MMPVHPNLAQHALLAREYLKTAEKPYFRRSPVRELVKKKRRYMINDIEKGATVNDLVAKYGGSEKTLRAYLRMDMPPSIYEQLSINGRRKSASAVAAANSNRSKALKDEK